MKKRIAIFMLIIMIASLLNGIAALNFYNKKIFIKNESIKAESLLMAISHRINMNFDSNIKTVNVLALSPMVKESLEQSNGKYDGKSSEEIISEIEELNKTWTDKSGNSQDEFIKSYLTNSVAVYFAQVQEQYEGLFGEIFLTNKYGEVIAATTVLSDIMDAQEDWWILSYNEGKGTTIIEESGFDESAGDYVIGFAVPVYGESGEVLGIIKANINSEILFNNIFEGFSDIKEFSEVFVARQNGYLLYGNSDKYSEDMLENYYQSKSNRQGFFSDMANAIASNNIISALPILKSYVIDDEIILEDSQFQGSIEDIYPNEGEPLYLIYLEPLSNITELSNSLVIGPIIYMIIFFTAIFLTMLFYVTKVTKPMEQLALAAEEIGKGNLNYSIDIIAKDETGKLTDSIKSMVQNLKKTLASRDELQAEILKREELQKEKDLYAQRMFKKQRMEAVGTLARGAAHEINNPLNGIMNYAELMKESECSKAQLHEFAGEILNEANRISEIVNVMVQFSNRTTNYLAKGSAENLIEDTLTLVKGELRRDEIEVVLDIEENIPEFDCRPQQLKHVLFSLMSNSIYSLNQKYSGFNSNKKIFINAEIFKKDNKDWLKITVKDMGLGIPKDIQSKLFDPFFTTKSRTDATGMGLYVSHNIIAEHNGTLTFETIEGQYAAFAIELPMLAY